MSVHPKAGVARASMRKEAVRGKPAQKVGVGVGKEKEQPDGIVQSPHFPVTQANTFPLWFRPLTLEARVV